MLNLADLKLPDYELKTPAGIHRYPVLETAYALDECQGEQNPAKLRTAVEKIFALPNITSYQATVVVQDFYKYLETTEVKEKLDEVFGQGLFSPTTSESAPETSKDSPNENISDASNV